MDNKLDCKKIKEAVCIDTSRVYDSCADKDCLSDLKVYLTNSGQNLIDNATSVRCRGCEVINVLSELEKIPFNRGFYSVDLTFFFKINLEVIHCPSQPTQCICGLSVFTKKCILYGSDGNVKIFSSEYKENGCDTQLGATNTNPKAKIQVAEPICLDARICRPCECCDNISDLARGVPNSIVSRFGEPLCCCNDGKAVKVTIGLFTIVQLERDVQMLIPAYDFCMPTKECCSSTEDPCDAFRKIKFPTEEFFPPKDDIQRLGMDNSFLQPQCGCTDNTNTFPQNNCGCGR